MRISSPATGAVLTNNWRYDLVGPPAWFRPNLLDAITCWAASADCVSQSLTVPCRFNSVWYGPNGFYREFTGSKNDPEVEISLKYEQAKTPGKLTGNIVLTFKNLNGGNHTLDIEDMSYKQAGKTITLDKNTLIKKEVFSLKNSFNWYDISVNVKGSSGFEKRYAGRVETGEHSKTDPFMGRVVK